jgi:D-beta-D-heptose 7-phosphate kinase / D-beta-D-heptose 1-phosphate adenosyltransferase
VRFDSLVELLSRFHSARVLVLGDVMLDRFVYGTVERISPEAPVPVVNVHRCADMPGGAANVARNIADLGAKATLLGVVGEDTFADDLAERLCASPTITPRLIRDPSRPTSVKTRYVADGQQVMRADSEVRTAVSTDIARCLFDEFEAAIEEAELVVLSDYAKGVLSDAVVRFAIETARRHDKPVVVDPKSLEFAKYRGATVITPNRLELARASGSPCDTFEQVVRGARSVLAQDICDAMVVTLGQDGICVVGADGADVHLPTSARQVFDVSGAGDTVVAALSLGLCAGGDVIGAGTIANVAAGIVVGKRGTATVTTAEIIAAMTPPDGRTDPFKIFTLSRVVQLVRSWREQGLKVAFTNGCFDLLHPGHISLLEQARRTADRLVVGLNADISVCRLKGPHRPVQSEVARATVLAAVKSVDAVVIFAEDTPLELIEALEPDVLVKGADYKLESVVGADQVLSRGGRVVLAQMLAGHSTTETVSRVAMMSGA